MLEVRLARRRGASQNLSLKHLQLNMDRLKPDLATVLMRDLVSDLAPLQGQILVLRGS